MGTLGYKRVSSMTDLASPGEGTIPHSQRGDGDEVAERAPMVPMREMLRELIRNLKTHGWHLVPSIGGDIAGFNLYTPATPHYRLGLNIPEGFKHLQKVSPDDPRFEGFCQRLLAECNSRRMSDVSDFEAKQWAKIVTAFLDRPKDGRTDVAMAAMSFMQEKEQQRTLAGTSGAYKFVPLKEWFPEAVQQVDVLSLFRTFLPEAETKALLLMLGKTLAGNKGAKCAEGVMPNVHFAAESVLIGFDGGEGKSTLLNTFIGETIELMGYNRATIDPTSTRFGNLWITSDFAYCDELNKAAHQRLLMEWALVKSVVTGEKRVMIEAKGIQGWEVDPSAQPFFSTNHYSDTDLAKADGGSLRRYFPMQCYGREESEILFGPNWKQTRLPQLWYSMAEELQTSIECLTAWVLRYAQDYYLETTGIKLTPRGSIEWHRRDNKLEETMISLRSQFRINVDMNHGKRLIDAIEMTTLAAIAVMEERYRVQVKNRIAELPLMPKALHAVIETWRHGEQLPEVLRPMLLEDISHNVRLTWDAQTDSLHNDCMTARSPAKVWERIMETLTVKGKEWHFQKSMSSYSVRWNTKLMVMPQKLEQLTPEVVGQIPELTYQHLKELGQAILITLNIVSPPRRR